MDQQQLAEELECPICCQTPRNPPIFECENGHLICCVCHLKMNECPQGKCKFNGQRSRLAENILEKANLPRPCKYSLSGCMHEEEISTLPLHEKECAFRMVNCPDPECYDKPLLKDVVLHVMQDHFLQLTETERQCNEDACLWVIEDTDFMRRSCDRTWPLSTFRFDGVLFFSMLMRSCHDHLWHAWTYLLGSANLADQYRCEIKLINGHDEVESLTYSGIPHPLDRSGLQVVKSSSTLAMTDSMVRKMLAALTDDQKRPGEEDQLKFLLSITYKVSKISGK